jgi:predicted nucleic acid-binding protein
MIFLDTGYFIALLDPNGALHSRAIAWSAAVRGPHVTTTPVVLEFFNHFSEAPRRSELHTLLRRFEGKPDFVLQQVDVGLWDRALKLHRDRADKQWSLTDCVSFSVMEERRITRALAYDHHFEQAGFEALLRRDPP